MDDSARRSQTLDREHDNNLDPAHNHPAVFRFLDLPPEMRNSIYGHLLTLLPICASPSSCFESCQPEILSTCRQIHNEAVGIMACLDNTDQPFNILFHADWTWVPVESHPYRTHAYELLKTVQIQNYGIYNKKDTRFEQLPNGSLAYPAYLRRVKRLHIEVIVETEHAEYNYGSSFVGSSAFARACIHTLVSFLMEGHSLQELRIKYSHTAGDTRHRSHRKFLDALTPLHRLRNIDIVEVLSTRNGRKMSSSVWCPWIKKMRTKTDSPPINILKNMLEIRYLCDAIEKRDDDDDERKAQHELLKIFYRYIMWELHFEASFSWECDTWSKFRSWEDKTWLKPREISDHLSWMKLRIIKMRKQDGNGSRDGHGSDEQTQSSARLYWEMLGEAAALPWPTDKEDISARRHAFELMEASCGSQEEAVLNELKKDI